MSKQNKQSNNDLLIYTEKDKDSFLNVLGKIVDDAQAKRLELLEPTRKEREAVMKVIKDFVKKNKRKIYGGYALNLLIKVKNPKDAFYTDLDTPDIEFYSPFPLQDLIELCDTFQEMGFKNVEGREAQHAETYTVFVNFEKYCDISYTPKNVYNRIPFRELEGFIIVDPSFLMVDILRAFNDPLTSYVFRLEKTYKRAYLLQKYYPAKRMNKPDKFPLTNSNVKALEIVKDFLKNKESTVTIGYYVFLYYISNGKLPKTESIPFFEFISINFRKDAYDLISLLKQQYEDPGRITVIEYYPFFQFYGHKAVILVDSVPIAHIYNNNMKCIPYRDIAEGKYKIRLGTYAYTLMMILILYHKARVDEDKINEQNYKYMYSEMIHTRNDFLKQNKKTIMDDTIYQEFQIACTGETLDPPRLFRLKIQKRKAKKQAYTFNYDPIKDRKKELDIPQFANTSGNIVRKDKNRKINIESVDSHEAIKNENINETN